MCGRITQYRSRRDYAEAVGFDMSDHRRWQGGDRIQAYNVPPGTWPWVLHKLHEGREAIDTVHWGYRPTWAIEKNLPMAINARVEKARTGNYFRHMWRQGRVIVPADGWYEWTGEPKHKQPWYVRLKTDEPMFMAAITNWIPYKPGPEGTGFVIVTSAAEGGLVDVHDRRPVVLSAGDAMLWMDNTLDGEQAESLARNKSKGPECFEWYQVSTEVNNARNDSPALVEKMPAG